MNMAVNKSWKNGLALKVTGFHPPWNRRICVGSYPFDFAVDHAVLSLWFAESAVRIFPLNRMIFSSLCFLRTLTLSLFSFLRGRGHKGKGRREVLFLCVIKNILFHQDPLILTSFRYRFEVPRQTFERMEIPRWLSQPAYGLGQLKFLQLKVSRETLFSGFFVLGVLNLFFETMG
jgi:hypothetical protein